MSLTGVPLLVLAFAATAAVGAATVLLWHRAGRWRLLPRSLGVLLLEALLVFSVGLAVNRAEQFYPSWQALTGDTGSITQTVPTRAGRLDAAVSAPPGSAAVIAWRPPDLSRWRLSGVPRIVLPADYRQRPADTFPVVLALVPDPGPLLATARRTPDVVTIVAVPTARTSAAALRNLPVQLSRDVRVTASGWDVAASGPQAALAAALIRDEPPGFAASRGWAPQQLAAPLAAPLRLPGMAADCAATRATCPRPASPVTARSGPPGRRGEGSA